MNTPFTVEWLGEDALLLRFGTAIGGSINSRVHACAAHIVRQRPVWLLDVVPAYATLALSIDLSAFPAASEPLLDVQRWLDACEFANTGSNVSAASRTHTIRVRYGGEDGPDLDAVAAHAGLTSAEVIAFHTGADYRVAMLGFAAGFPYLIGMHSHLNMARHATPRIHVAAGSVGIGGAQTGIYPRSGPGGWQIIGRTELMLFDANNDPPATLSAGDAVRFVAIVDPGENLT